VAVTLDINIAHGLLGHPDMRTVRSMASKHGWTLTGSVQPCGLCALAEARAKAIPKSTLTKAKVAGERLFLDISGPYSDSLNQNKYWLRIVDDFTRYSWDCFLPAKSGIHVPLGNLLVANKAAGNPCKFLRCDNCPMRNVVNKLAEKYEFSSRLFIGAIDQSAKKAYVANIRCFYDRCILSRTIWYLVVH
jgi:hypothetical protein